MVDDVRNINETAESKEAIDRARLARERREAEQRKRLDELRAHAAAAQAQREKRDEDRRKRQAEQRARDDDRRLQVEERKRAIWEASISRREALLQRERDRAERLERARAARSSPRPAFAFGSSTPRLLDPLDSAGFFWAARSTNPIDQMNYFDSLAASTTNVMFASAPLTRRASALQLDSSDTDNKDEPDRQPPPAWSSVARRRTDLVPTVPLGRAPGRAHSMTRLDRLPPTRPIHSASPSMHHLNRTQPRSGETTPGSRPGSALSTAAGAAAGVVRRPSSAPRKPRPASIAGTGVNTPRAGVCEVGGASGASSAATTPCMSRDGSVGAAGTPGTAGTAGTTGTAGITGTGDAPPRRSAASRRPRPLSLHSHSPKPATPAMPGEGKPPVHRKPKPSKEHDKTPRGKSLSASPGRTLSPSPATSKEPSQDKDVPVKMLPAVVSMDKSQVSAAEVTQKLEALQVQEMDTHTHQQTIENKESVDMKEETKVEQVEKSSEQKIEVQKPVEKREVSEKRDDVKEPSQEKTDDNEMTASMSAVAVAVAVARRITTEQQAKAALAERRRRARDLLERQAEVERQRLEREAEEEAERQRLEEERQRREEEEARELAQLQRQMDEEKLRKAIEVQQQLERDEAERKLREEADKQARLREDEEKRRAAEEAEKLRREEAEKEEKERLLRKQRVEAIMARTRLRKQAEEQKQQDKPAAPVSAPTPSSVPAQDSAPAPTPVTEAGPATVPETAPTSVPDAAPTSVTETAPTSVTEPAPIVLEATPVTAVTEAAPTESVQESKPVSDPVPAVQESTIAQDNGNIATGDLLGFNTSQVEVTQVAHESVTSSTESNPTPNNGNLTADLLGLSEQNNTKDSSHEQQQVNTKQIDNAPTNQATNNGNVHPTSNIGHISANFLQTERAANESQTKMADVNKLLDDDFTTHNGHGAHSHPLTLQNAI